MKKLLTIIFFSFIVLPTFAQQDAQFSQYMFNKLYLNPAVAGTDPDWANVSLIHRSQWLGYDASFDDGSAPTTQVLSLNMPITKHNLGAGLHIVNDVVGIQETIEIQLSTAYHIKLSTGLISLGIRGGLYNHSIDASKLRPVDEDDPVILSLQSSGSNSQFTSDFAVGAYYLTSKYFLGVSMNHLQRSDFNYGTEFSAYTLENHLNFMGGVNFDLNRDWVLSPSTIMKTDFNSYSFEGSVIASYNDKYHVGVSLRELEAAILLAGISLTKDNRFKIGYAFDYTLDGSDAKARSSHEIMLAYNFLPIVIPGPNIIRTPRFRHERHE